MNTVSLVTSPGFPNLLSVKPLSTSLPLRDRERERPVFYFMMLPVAYVIQYQLQIKSDHGALVE
jgi:hypothetical protein